MIVYTTSVELGCDAKDGIFSGCFIYIRNR